MYHMCWKRDAVALEEEPIEDMSCVLQDPRTPGHAHPTMARRVFTARSREGQDETASDIW